MDSNNAASPDELNPPHGGSWIRNPETGELTPAEDPAAASAAAADQPVTGAA